MNPVILQRDEDGILTDQEGHVCNAQGQRLDREGNPIVPVAVVGADEVQRGAQLQCQDDRERTLADFNRPDEFYRNRSAIRLPTFDRNDFELKPSYYTLVGQHPFHGLSHEHPMDHIERLEDLVTSMKHNGVSYDYLFWTLSIVGYESHVLFDSGASHSFVTPSWVYEKGIQELSGDHSRVMKVVGGRLLETQGCAEGIDILIAGELMRADLIVCPVELYDVILGMDWLERFKAHLDCHRGRVIFERVGRRLVYQGVRLVSGSIAVSAIQDERLIELGCEAYLATISMSGEVGESSLKDIKVVQDFEDVFQPLKGLPPSRSGELTVV